jgi:arylsulfatase A-like enzyme
MATIAEFSSGFPGISTRIPFENGFISEVLVERGYNTYCVGKWHLTPGEEATSAYRPLAPRAASGLRVPRRRGQPVVSRPRAGQQPDTPGTGGRVPPVGDLADQAIRMIRPRR